VSLRDISVAVRVGTPEWPGDTPYSCGWTARIAEGSSVNLTSITTSPHVGTHADAPLHVRDGAPGSESLDVRAFLGRAYVLSIAGPIRDIGADEVTRRVPTGTERVLLRTGQAIAAGAFPPDWPALDVGAARALGALGVRLLGVDAPSVDRRHSKSLAVHHALFAAGIAILENLDLRGVDDGEYDLVALPVRWDGVDAAPVRALLRDAVPDGGR
jgi:arylformamidase